MKRSYIIGFALMFLLIGCTKADPPDYWSESSLCDTKEECIERGDQYGENIFSTLGRTFSFSDQDFFWYVGLEDDEYIEGKGFSFDDFVIAESTKTNNSFEQTMGEEHPFFEQMHTTVANLLFDDYVDITTIQFLSDGYPYINIFGDENILGIPQYLDSYSSQYTIYLLMHELAHVATMTDILKTDACAEVYSIDACFEEDSYMQKFAKEFWTEHPEQWRAFDYQSMNYEERRDFYDANPDHFVSLYASISPQEDIAESFARFVLSPYIEEATTIAEEKIIFFYAFDEFVEYRARVLNHLQETYEQSRNFY